MKLSFRNAALPFGERIKTTFIDADEQQADSVYSFVSGPSATIERTNDDRITNGVWQLTFDGPARIYFERGLCHFTSATVVQTGTTYEMFVTVLYRSKPSGDRMIYTSKEL
ncbi:hypothetical protein SNO30_003058 [Cronobacter sakazakii]|nr:hypothetical protein [Cronobacter sakazakii]ELY6168744.1 hypothetical protein [Cronobacter sakazakii]